MLTKKKDISADDAEKFINSAAVGTPNENTVPKTPEKTKPDSFLNVPMRRELRNRLKANAALSGKSLYEYCAEILEKALETEDKT